MNVVDGIRVGDFVKVEWRLKNPSPWDGYAPRGTVVQATDRLVILRAPAGYHFTVSRSHLAQGVRLRKAGGDAP
ncbi:MAG: hypothetical protein AB1327_11480 [Bacillota bacterium]